jgi:hypothetical protein
MSSRDLSLVAEELFNIYSSPIFFRVADGGWDAREITYNVHGENKHFHKDLVDRDHWESRDVSILVDVSKIGLGT